MIFTDTIVASATPIGAPTALSVIRISGPLSKDILSHITTKKIDKILPRKAYFLKLKDEDNFIDEAVVIFLKLLILSLEKIQLSFICMALHILHKILYQ